MFVKMISIFFQYLTLSRFPSLNIDALFSACRIKIDFKVALFLLNVNANKM